MKSLSSHPKGYTYFLLGRQVGVRWGLCKYNTLLHQCCKISSWMLWSQGSCQNMMIAQNDVKTWSAEGTRQDNKQTNVKTWKPRWEYPGSCWQPGCARCARWGVCRGKSESIFYLFERASWGIENLKVLSILLKEHLEVLKIWKYFPSFWKSIVTPTCGSRRAGAGGER